ncbi:phage/plasmid primase, P4 family [Sulfitobacter sp. 1A16787]|uniref:DNA primase family protein n=1 Tax=Sulfitobacter sp. 1A16787 TaxID=3368571 RepID=UPI003745A1AA
MEDNKTDGAAQVASALDQAAPVEAFGMEGEHGKTCETQQDDPGYFEGAEPRAEGGEKTEAEALREARLKNCALHPLTDYGNGLRLLEHYGEDVLFVPRLGWFRWDGRKWQADEDAFLVRCDAQGVAELILEEIPHLALEPYQRDAVERAKLTAREYHILAKRQRKDDDLNEEETARLAELEEIRNEAAPARKVLAKKETDHRSHAKSSGNSGRISNMIQEASARRRVDIGDMNADPLLINCENGMLRLVEQPDEHGAAWGERGTKWGVELVPHDRRAMASKMMCAAYVPGAKRVAFERFLASIQPDPAMREYLKRWFGYTLTGLTSEQKLAFFYGVGRNGKSTLVDVIAKIVDDYGTTIPIETLTGTEQRKGSEATPDLVRLPGARMVRASEPEQGQKMREALVKSLTGGEPVLIRRMHSEFVQVMPEFKLTISGNHRPEIRGGDDGIWRRIMLVPFDTQVPLEDVDPLLPQKLWDEREGIFAWMVEGALAYLESGLAIPESITSATQAYRMDSEPMRVFLLEECNITGQAEDYTFTRELGQAFNAWLLSSGGSTWTKGFIAKKLKYYAETLNLEGGGFSYKKKSDAGYMGISLSKTAKDRVETYSFELGKVTK